MSTHYKLFLKDYSEYLDRITILAGDNECPQGQVWRNPHTIQVMYRGQLQDRAYPRRRFKTWINDSGYTEFSFRNKIWLLHRAIAEVYLPDDFYNNEEVNHKDGDKLNNRLSNLECISHDANVQHAMESTLIPAFPVLDLVTNQIYRSAGELDRHLHKYDGYTVNKLLHDRVVEGHPTILLVPIDRFIKYQGNLKKYHTVLIEYPDGHREVVNLTTE